MTDFSKAARESADAPVAQITPLLAELTRADLTVGDVLSVACRHAQRITGAAGAVIEMLDGDDMVYRAATGTLEPHIGMRIRRDGSLSGYAVANGMQLCADSETDMRVDRASCQKVGARSMIIVPLRFGDISAGVLKVTSPEPDGFDETAIQSLQVLAGLLALGIRRAQELEKRNTMQEALAASEARWRSVADLNLAGSYVIESKRFVYVNDRFCEMLGYSREELLAMPSSLIPVDPVDRDFAAVNLAARERGAIHDTGHELRCVRKDGMPVVLQIFSSAIDNENHARSVIGTVIDVTERKRADGVLRASEEWFRTLIEGASDMIAVLTLDGFYKYTSPSVTEQLGYLQSDLAGRNAFCYVHQDDVERVQRELADLIHSDVKRAETRLRFRHAKGGWRDCDVRLRLVDGPDGDPLVIANSRDITEQQSLQRQFADAEKLASLGRVASSMAHEFNNVLMGIQPFADIIARVTDPARLQKAATGIQNAVRRGRTITQQVLRFTRGEKPERRSIVVENVFTAVQQQLVPLLPAGITLEIEATPPDLRMLADSDQIEQALMNLCLNARDAMPDGGTIRMTAGISDRRDYSFGVLAQEPGQLVHIKVADAGAGIPEELKTRIFEPLFTTKKALGGSGLGLTIAQQIASRHHGMLFVESEVGIGSSFHLFVPLAPEPALAREVPVTEQPAGLRRVLIVEDDDLVADAVMAALSSLNIESLRASTGAAASGAAATFHPDLALVDYGLPDMKGTDVYRILRRRWPDLPVVFATGHADADSLQGEVGAERIEICFKPFEVTRLLQAMAAALARRAVSGGLTS